MRFSDRKLLNEALLSDIMTPDVLEILLMKKKEKLLQVHPYKISEPQGSGRWMTYLKDPNGKRRKVTATTEEILIEKVYSHYFDSQDPTLRAIHEEWIQKRKDEGVSDYTIRRNQNHWKKYYLDHRIIDESIEAITTKDIEDFLYSCIKKFDMTVKELKNMRFIIKDMLTMARKKSIIDDNPFNDVEVRTHGCLPPPKHNKRTQVYSLEEKEKMFKQLNKEVKNDPNSTDCYAISLLFKLGLRVGEVVAIKECDIDFKNKKIHIHRMETKKFVGDQLKPTVVNHTKKKSSHGDRYLPLSEYDIKLIKKVKKINKVNSYSDDGFLFVDEDGRTKVGEIDVKIRKLCNHAGIPEKSAHDIRRTVASEMFAKGVTVEIIRDYLGHSDIKTTWGYIFDNNEEERTAKIISDSLMDMNSLRIS